MDRVTFLFFLLWRELLKNSMGIKNLGVGEEDTLVLLHIHCLAYVPTA